MNGDLDIMIAEDHRDLLGKWMKILLYMKLVSFGNILLGLLPFGDGIVRLIAFAVNGACVYVLFRMSPVCKRYRTVAILNGVLMVSGLLPHSVLALVFSICSLVADYQEYAGHGDVTAGLDEKLAGKWRFLFWLEIIVTMGLSVLMAIGLVIVALVSGGTPAQTDTVGIVSTVTEILMRVIYLVYLNKTVKLFTE